MKKLKTHKAVYNYVRKHLLAQRKRAITTAGNTRHKTEDCMCSIGCLAPLEWYQKHEPSIWTLNAPEVHLYEAVEFFDENTGSSSYDMAAIAKYHGLKCTKETAELFHDLETVHEEFQPKDWRAALDNIKYVNGW